jgi:hypothetical protein
MDGRQTLVLAAGVTIWLASPARSARAQESGDRKAAEALVKELREDAAHTAMTADATARAAAALEKATRMQAAGDEKHAREAEGLAREWAETGREIARAAAAEAQAADLRQKALDTQAKLERDRALVEEGIARVGRLTAELNRATQSPARVAVEVHDGEPPAKRPSKTEKKLASERSSQKPGDGNKGSNGAGGAP